MALGVSVLLICRLIHYTIIRIIAFITFIIIHSLHQDEHVAVFAGLVVCASARHGAERNNPLSRNMCRVSAISRVPLFIHLPNIIYCKVF